MRTGQSEGRLEVAAMQRGEDGVGHLEKSGSQIK